MKRPPPRSTRNDTLLPYRTVFRSGGAWKQWVPHLAAQYRVIRPDRPGFGQSPTPADYNWSADELASDLIAFVDALGVERVHIVAAKYGGTVAMVLASKLGERVISLSLLGAPHKGDGVEIGRAHV